MKSRENRGSAPRERRLKRPRAQARPVRAQPKTRVAAERRPAEEALRESQARLASFAEATFEGIVESEGGRIIDCNEQFARMLGYTVAELRGMPIVDVVCPEDRERVFANVRHGRDSVIEHGALRRDGTRIVVEAHGRSLSPGSARRHTAVRDITERKRAEEALQKSEQRFASLARQSPVGIFETDAQGDCLFVNEYWQALAGLSAAGAAGQGWRTGIHPEDRERVSGEWYAAARAGRDFASEYRFRTPQGKVSWVMGGARPIRDDAGNVLRYLGTVLNITERKQAERAVAATQWQVQSIIDNGTSIIYVLDLDERFLMANATLAKLLSSTPQQMIGKRRHELMPKEDADWHEANDRQVLEAGRACEFEEYSRLKGRSITWLTTKFPLRDAQGRIYAIAGISADVSARKQAEEELRRSEERYRTLFETLIEGFCIIEMVFDPEGKPVDYRFLEVNPAFEGQTGLHNAQGKSMRDLAPNHEAHWFEVYGKVALTGEPARFVAEAKALNRWFEVFAYRLGQAESRKVAILFNDITERKRAEEAMRESERQLRALADSIPNLAWWANGDGYITWYNQRWYEYTGTTSEQMEGWGWQSVHDPELLPKVLERWRASIATGEPFSMEFPLRGADGRFRWFLTRVMPLRDGSNHVVRWFGTNTDITDLREAREVLARNKEELERLVAERTAELRRYRDHLEELVKERTGELLRTTAELTRSNRELEQFAYAASHDLQEPLRAVSGYVQLLERRLPQKLDEKSRHYIQGATEGSARMSRQIMDLLELSRVGTRGLHLARTDLAAPLNIALGNLQFGIKKADARVTSDPLPTLLVDGSQIVLLFQNLIGNALKFRGESAPQIHVGARREGGRWVIGVRDNGIGIEPEYFERIFQVFQRLHTRDKYPGTGVGLALCRRVVERHGGQIWVESQAGQGATFYFSLPDGAEGR